MSEIYALDIETAGLSRFKDRILGIGVYSPNYQQYFDSVTSFTSWLFSLPIKPLFVTHNGAFDIGFLRHNNLDLRNYWYHDTRSLASLVTPRPESLGLEPLSKQFLGVESYKLNRKNMTSYSRDEVAAYCLKDCQNTYELRRTLLSLNSFTQAHIDFFENWCMPATKFLADMEYDGVYIDREGLLSYNKLMVTKRDQILNDLKERANPAIKAYHELQVINVRRTYKEMYEKAKTKNETKKPFEKFGENTKLLRRYALLESAAISRLEPFNWNSSDQIKWLLKDYFSLDIFNSRENKETTNEAKLRDLSQESEICKLLLSYRETEKLIGTCIPALQENCDENGFVHTHYHIGGTRTGRLSSSTPNLQQIPRGALRSYVQASKRSLVLVTIDYAQIEVRVIAELAQENELIHAFKEGIDPYSLIAQKLLKINAPVKEIKEKFKKERDVSKTAGLSILYGTGAYKLQEVLKKDLGRNLSIADCKRFIEDYRNSLPGVKSFKRSLERSLANQKIAFNLLGRPFLIETNDDIYMKGLNTLVQGSASDLVIHSALKVKAKLDKLGVVNNCRLLIHDEQVWELEADEAEMLVNELIVPTMTTEVVEELGLTVPLKVEYTINREWSKP